MSAWEALIGDDYLGGGIRLAWRREVPGGLEYTNGLVGWTVTGNEPVEPTIEPLTLRDEMGRTLLAALLHHYNGADDARMLRKDYDAERARVDRLIGALIPDRP